MATIAEGYREEVIWPTGKVNGQLIYAIGDIHGCYDQLKLLLEDIASDVQRLARDVKPSLVFCGDYVDRGPASRDVIEALCWLKRHKPFHLHYLMGNHERVMLDYIENPVRASAWLRFGGAETLKSYGVSPPAADDGPQAHLAARDDLLDRLPVTHLRFLQELELMVSIGDFAFVHAGVKPGVPLRRQAQDDLLWIREGFLDSETMHERIIVHGHSWHGDSPQLRSNRIGIDTGAYETGVLTALRLQDDELHLLATR